MINEGIRMEYTTGNLTVDAVGALQFSGNVVPHIWYRTITRENGRPYLLAIVILSDIVYWYRPMEVRDEVTGQLVRYRKRFSQDLLQRSYDQMAEMFGESKRSVTDAIVRLEKLGIVKRVFRTIESGGMKCANVLFLDLDPVALYRVTFPEECIPDTSQGGAEINLPQSERREESAETGVSHFSVGDVPKKREGCPEISGHPSPKSGTPLPQIRETNTENITKIITENISSSIRAAPDMSIWMDDENSIKERLGYESALRDYPAELVEMVYREIEKRQKDVLPFLSRESFLAVCRNITMYAGNIQNGPAYIQKCLDNLLSGIRIGEISAARKFNMKHGFQQREYDFESMEKRLLEL